MKKAYFLIGFLVLLLSAIVGFGTYYVSSAYIAADQQVIDQAKALLASSLTLTPIEGTNTNLLSMVRDSLSTSITEGTKIRVISSTSSQISPDGTITYGSTPTTATVTVKIRKRRCSTTQQVTVVIPAATETNETSTSTGTDSGSSGTSTDTGGSSNTDTSSDTTNTSTGNTSSDTTTNTDTMPAGALNVKNYGAKGDGVTDDTNAINAAVTAAYNGGGGTVWVPDGTYMIRTSAWGGGINMKSNTSLYLASGAVLKQIANSYDGSYIVAVRDISNVTITGGTITGDRHTHTGTSGEWGMGIDVEGSTNITISNITVQDCWGDGIYVGSSYSKTYSQNVMIQNTNVDGNRRNGIAVISVKQMTIKDSTVSNTDGTMPGSGIDMEPNYSNEFMQDVTIQNIKSYNNGVDGSPFGGWAVDVWFGCGTENPDVTPKSNVSIKISNVTDSGSYRGLFTTNFSHYISYGYNIVK